MIEKKWRLALAILLQVLLMALWSGLWLWASLVFPSEVGGVVYDIAMWALIPLMGALTACLAVRRGLHHYLAWMLPPAVQLGVQWMLTGVLPASFGMLLATALLSALGSGAGEEMRKRAQRSGKGR